MSVPHPEDLPRHALDAIQAERLVALGRALSANRFYQARGVDLRSPADLVRLPFTTKADLIADQTTHPPYGTNHSEPLARYCRLHQTSGTSSGRPLRILDLPVADLYDEHWSITGRQVPGADTPDEAVFLPGRNVLLLAKAMLWCHLHGVPAVALGLLASNPFPDATPAFFAAYQDVVNQAVGGHVEVLRPFAGLHKEDLVRRGRDLPLELTFSCIRPAFLTGRVLCSWSTTASYPPSRIASAATPAFQCARSDAPPA